MGKHELTPTCTAAVTATTTAVRAAANPAAARILQFYF